MESLDLLGISADAKGVADTWNALPCHEVDKFSTKNPNSYIELGRCTVTAGFIGRGKIIPTNSSTWPHDAIGGSTLADGIFTIDALRYVSCGSHGTAS